jgi:hypothetical protein
VFGVGHEHPVANDMTSAVIEEIADLVTGAIRLDATNLSEMPFFRITAVKR